MTHTKTLVATLGIALTLTLASMIGSIHTTPQIARQSSAIASIKLPASAVAHIRSLPDQVIPPCAHEDSDDCFWDAKAHGNDQGRSFISIQGVTYYAH